MLEKVSSLLVPDCFHHEKETKSECVLLLYYCTSDDRALSFKISTNWDPSHGIPYESQKRKTEHFQTTYFFNLNPSIHFQHLRDVFTGPTGGLCRNLKKRPINWAMKSICQLVNGPPVELNMKRKN